MSSTATAEPRNKQQESFSFEDAKDQNNDSEAKPMNPSTAAGQPCLQLKGSLVPMTVLELNYYDPIQFNRDLEAKTAQAPDFFENLPVIISLEKLNESEQIPFKQMIETCLRFSIKVVAVRGGSDSQQKDAKQAGLGVLSKQKERAAEPEPTVSSHADTSENVRTETKTVEVVKTVIQKERQISKVVKHPIRSGQQIYAADGDLIILASVSAGAEILADGNIHVYGTLRGRALAGVKGDVSARIFCHSLEAELVSVAGQYKISEDIENTVRNKPTQVYLDKDSLCFSEIEL